MSNIFVVVLLIKIPRDDLVLPALGKAGEFCREAGYPHDQVRIFFGVLLRVQKLLFRCAVQLE